MANLLAANLKMAHGGTAMRFAFIANGASGKLLVAKSVPPTQISEAKKAAGGGSVFQGRCVGEEGILFFEVDKAPPGNLLGQLKRCIKDEASLTWPIEFRIGADTPPPADGAPAAAPAASDARGRFQDRFKALLGPVGKAVAAKVPASTELKQTALAAQASARQEDWPQANALLDRLTQLLTPAADPSVAAASAFKERLKALADDLKKALASGTEAGKIAKARLAEAQAAFGKKEFAPALALLDAVAEQAKKALAPLAAAPAPAADLTTFKARANTVKAAIAVVKTTDAGRAAALVKQLVQALGAAQAKDWPTALPLLDALEADVTAAAVPNEWAATYKELRSTLATDLPRLRAADATAAEAIQKVVDAAAAQADQGDFPNACTTLERATDMLAAAQGAARAKDARDVIPPGKVAEMRQALEKARLRWDSGIQQAVAEMKKVQDGLKELHPPLAVALNSILEGYQKELLGILAPAAKAKDGPEVDRNRAEVLKKATDLKAQAAGDRLLAHLDAFPLGSVKLQKTIDLALTEIQAYLQA